jgi:hypothetical protein
MLHDAGILRTECRLTNVVRYRPPGNDLTQWLTPKKKDALERGLPHFADGLWYNDIVAEGLNELAQEIKECQPNVIIGFGNTPLWALTGKTGIGNWRGSELATRQGPKAVVTYHPAGVLRQYEWRPQVVADLRRGLREAERRDLVVPPYDFLLRPTLATVVEWLSRLRDRLAVGQLRLSVDIETRLGHIACIGIADSRHHALCIPLLCLEDAAGYWSADDEVAIYPLLREVLTHPNARIVGQNFLYDAQYFARHLYYIPRCTDDTMLMQHLAFPGSQKSLAYLASLYCEHYTFWKEDGKLWDPRYMSEDQLWRYNCLTGDTLILDALCSWKRLDTVSIGDALLAFDEEPTGARYARKLSIAFVTNKKASVKPTVKITLRNGTTLQGTKDHKVMVQKEKKSGRFIGVEWKELGELVVGERVLSIGRPWEKDDTFSGGWLAGIYDGEGTIGASYQDGNHHFPRIGFSQKAGRVLQQAVETLEAAGFSLRVVDKGTAVYVDINGGLAENLRLLGTFPTVRLQNTFLKGAMEHGWSGFTQITRQEVRSIEPAGEETVYDITTTSGTFIANGVVVHNCEDAVRTYECAEELDKILDTLQFREHYVHQMRLWQATLRTMLRGVRIDQGRKNRLAMELIEAADIRQKQINLIVGHELNCRSPLQMRKLFYDDLKLPEVHHRKSGNVTLDDKALESLAGKQPLIRPLVERIQQLRSIGVFLSTFVQSRLDTDNRMRCSFNPTGTETFRFSSSENAFGSGTNLQNLPKGDEE